jgi:hypothetical protein
LAWFVNKTNSTFETRNNVTEDNDGSFSESMRRRLLEDFVVSYYNGTLNPNIAEKDPSTGRDVEFLMDAPQFDKIRKSDVWSFSNAVGTGYQYRVVYKDRRFSDMGRLVGVYSGTSETAGEDRTSAEQDLYQLILVMIKEGRMPKSFKIRSSQEVHEQKVIAMVEELGRTMEELARKVRAIEEKLATQPASPVPDDRAVTSLIAEPDGPSQT